MIDTTCCLGSCITGQWEQVQADLQRFADYVGRRETGKKLAEFVGACGASTENLTNIINNIISLRPVVTRVYQESGKATQSLYLMTKQQLHTVWSNRLSSYSYQNLKILIVCINKS